MQDKVHIIPAESAKMLIVTLNSMKLETLTELHCLNFLSIYKKKGGGGIT